MAKVTSKLQVTLPKRIAEHHGIAPGDEIEFQSAGDVIRIVPAGREAHSALGTRERLRLFDEATARQRKRTSELALPGQPPVERDWTREDLYTRDKSD
ncbi:MAG: AbrB/MazE/SpoVT family DNA-binding domain-containing protein [Wenzhouxiangellaceae bacterium]|nr:AbrB/MazE/SpoVT family DNA-binding domain-containing protein [Wenzhouxiangellaceae bacterium]